MKISSKELTHILISIVFFSIFLFIFFFTFANIIEEKVVLKQVEIVANEFIDDFKNMNIPLEKVKLALDKIKLSNMSKEDEKTKEKNRKVLIKGLILIGMIVLIGTIIIYYILKNNHVNLKEILRRNFLVLIFIFLIEVSFLLIIAKNYISVDPFVLKSRIIENLMNLGK
jgi:hypothetical protein